MMAAATVPVRWAANSCCRE